MTQRVTPQQVVEAYRSTGIKPARKTWHNDSGPVRFGCGLTAVYCGLAKPSSGQPVYEIEWVLRSQLGLSQPYIDGFVQGFDGAAALPGRTGADFALGNEDGLAAWKACVAAGLVQEGK